MVQIELAKILVDPSINPRDSLNPKHIDEFVEMGGNWPPVLVRPIEHAVYTHQLIDGFHRFKAAERLALGVIECRSEEMDDTEALARALRENLHGQPLTTEERRRVVLSLRRKGWTQDRIAKETGVNQGQIFKYLAAERLEQEYYDVIKPESPKLPLNQAAAISKLLDEPSARPHIPALIQAVTENTLPEPTTLALAKTALEAPEHLPALLLKTVEEQLPPESVKAAQQILADPETPPALKEHILQPGTAIMDRHEALVPAEVERLEKVAMAEATRREGLPFVQHMSRLAAIADSLTEQEVLEGLQAGESDDLTRYLEIISATRDWLDGLEQHIQQKRKSLFAVMRG